LKTRELFSDSAGRGVLSSHVHDLQLLTSPRPLPKAFPSTGICALSLHKRSQLCWLTAASPSEVSGIYSRKSSIRMTSVIQLETNATAEYYQEYSSGRLLGKPKRIYGSLESQTALYSLSLLQIITQLVVEAEFLKLEHDLLYF